MDGLRLRRRNVPKVPIIEDRMKPGRDRSTRYHSTGFIRVRANETCRVDVQSSFRWLG